MSVKGNQSLFDHEPNRMARCPVCAYPQEPSEADFIQCKCGTLLHGQTLVPLKEWELQALRAEASGFVHPDAKRSSPPRQARKETKD